MEFNDKTPIYVRIFDENWNELEYQELQSGDSYTVTASSGSGVYHVKYESDGYLPFYLKDFWYWYLYCWIWRFSQHGDISSR